MQDARKLLRRISSRLTHRLQARGFRTWAVFSATAAVQADYAHISGEHALHAVCICVCHMYESTEPQSHLIRCWYILRDLGQVDPDNLWRGRYGASHREVTTQCVTSCLCHNPLCYKERSRDNPHLPAMPMSPLTRSAAYCPCLGAGDEADAIELRRQQVRSV